jgi:hypothetical protein
MMKDERKSEMPRACPVEVHGGRYDGSTLSFVGGQRETPQGKHVTSEDEIMALPVPATLTCDICRGSTVIGGGPTDVAGVPCVLVPRFQAGMEQEHDAHYWGTHLLLVDLTVDIRDCTDPSNHTINTSVTDYVFIPNRSTGTRWTVIWVERSSYGAAGDHKRVYIQRLSGNLGVFPTDNL